MIDSISPTTKATLDEKGVPLPIDFVLEDKDYLLIKAIHRLADEINMLRTRK